MGKFRLSTSSSLDMPRLETFTILSVQAVSDMAIGHLNIVGHRLALREQKTNGRKPRTTENFHLHTTIDDDLVWCLSPYVGTMREWSSSVTIGRARISIYGPEHLLEPTSHHQQPVLPLSQGSAYDGGPQAKLAHTSDLAFGIWGIGT